MNAKPSFIICFRKGYSRITADSFDIKSMQTIANPPKGVKWGSLKSLENLLTAKYDLAQVRQVTAALVGVYELRLADAHLPSSKIDDAFTLIGIDRSKPYVHQGYEMLCKVVSSLATIANMLERWDS